MEVEANDTISFFGVLVMKKCLKLATKVCRKPIHTGRNLHLHPHHVKSAAFHGLINRAKVRVRRISARKLRT
jgi:hypothetical protein